MSQSPDVEPRIDRLDLSLFAAIDTQSDDGDKRSWLALQRLVARRQESYVFLEIGSFRGGSLQPYLLDPRCRRIFSIDKRTAEPPDLRGQWHQYENNSTAGMLDNLRALDPAQVAKVVCFDSDARDVDPARVPEPPDLCFIDGEHTESAVVSDFEFCLSVCSPQAILYFHDDWVIYPALARILRTLRRQGRRFRAFKLQGSTFAIALDRSDLPEDELIRGIAVDGRRFILHMRAYRFLKRTVPAPLLPAVRRLRGLLGGRP